MKGHYERTRRLRAEVESRLTQPEQVFVNAICSGKSYAESAKLAGFDARQGQGVLRRSQVLDVILGRYALRDVSWVRLILKAKKFLDSVFDDPEAKRTEKLNACRIVMQACEKGNVDLLSDRQEYASREAAVDEVLGSKEVN